MGQDEKTLRIVVSKDSDNQQSQPSGPPSPKAPASPSAPPQAPSNQTRPTAPASPTVTLPKSPPQITTAPAAATATPIAPAAAATGTAAATGVQAAGGVATAGGAAVGSVFPPLLIAAGVLTIAFGAAAVAVRLVDNAFAAMASRLKEYDPGLAVASGISEMRQIQAEFKAAHDRSGVLQQYTQRKTDLEITVSHIETFLTNHVGPILIKALDFLESFAIVIEAILNKIQEAEAAVKQHVPVLLQWMLPIFWDWREINKKLARWLGVQLDDADASSFQKDILEAIDPHGALSSAMRGEGKTQEGNRTPRGIEL